MEVFTYPTTKGHHMVSVSVRDEVLVDSMDRVAVIAMAMEMLSDVDATYDEIEDWAEVNGYGLSTSNPLQDPASTPPTQPEASQ